MSILSRLFGQSAATPTRAAQKRPSPDANRLRRRPVLEALEDRFAPAVFTVTNLADGNGAGTLRTAVAQANANFGADNVEFSPGLLGGTITLTQGRITINSPTTIRGLGANRLTISGNDISQIFYVDGSSAIINATVVTISDLTMTAGRANASTGVLAPTNFTGGTLDTGFFGGAIFNNQASLTLRRVEITNSQAGNSGGAVMNGRSITGNSVTGIEFSTLTGNSATFIGGALYNFGSNVAIANSTISRNLAGTSGGGFYNQGTLSLANATVTLNAADSDNSNANFSAETGGGIFNETGSLTLLNSIIAGNFQDGTDIQQPSIQSDDMAGANATTANNNLISDPSPVIGIANGFSGNIVGDGLGGGLFIGDILDIGLIDPVNFILSAAEGLIDNGGPTRTHALVQNSLAIGAGAKLFGSSVAEYDQRGATRDVTAIDIGAYEVQSPLAPVGVPTTYPDTFQPKPSGDVIEAFLKGLYQSTLLRAADAGGLTFWRGRINAGLSRQEVAFGFVNSNENRGNQVTFFYRYFLGRGAEPNGLNFHVQRLLSGTDEGEVMTGFVLSDEFSGQNTDQQFVNLMYYALLGRNPEPAGFNFWMGQITSGSMTRGEVVPNFLRSNEGIDRVTNAFAGSYVKRNIDAPSRTNLRNAANSGSTFGNIASQILAFQEYFDAATANVT